MDPTKLFPKAETILKQYPNRDAQIKSWKEAANMECRAGLSQHTAQNIAKIVQTSVSHCLDLIADAHYCLPCERYPVTHHFNFTLSSGSNLCSPFQEALSKHSPIIEWMQWHNNHKQSQRAQQPLHAAEPPSEASSSQPNSSAQALVTPHFGKAVFPNYTLWNQILATIAGDVAMRVQGDLKTLESKRENRLPNGEPLIKFTLTKSETNENSFGQKAFSVKFFLPKEEQLFKMMAEVKTATLKSNPIYAALLSRKNLLDSWSNRIENEIREGLCIRTADTLIQQVVQGVQDCLSHIDNPLYGLPNQGNKISYQWVFRASSVCPELLGALSQSSVIREWQRWQEENSAGSNEQQIEAKGVLVGIGTSSVIAAATTVVRKTELSINYAEWDWQLNKVTTGVAEQVQSRLASCQVSSQNLMPSGEPLLQFDTQKWGGKDKVTFSLGLSSLLSSGHSSATIQVSFWLPSEKQLANPSIPARELENSANNCLIA